MGFFHGQETCFLLMFHEISPNFVIPSHFYDHFMVFQKELNSRTAWLCTIFVWLSLAWQSQEQNMIFNHV